jgi:outer membrane protein OmpA-like peptidoglycan-associated protein/sugar lactone lactonase YvrE
VKVKIKLLALVVAAFTSFAAVGTASAATAELFWNSNMNAINDVAVDSSGNVFAGYSMTVAKVTSAGTASSSWASLGAGNYTYSVAVGPNGSIAAAKAYSGIAILDSAGTTTYSYSGISGLSKFTSDGSGNVWWVNGNPGKQLGRIPAGTSSGAVPTPKTLSDPTCDVVTNAAGDAYVGTGSGNTVQKFTGSGFSSSSTAAATYVVGSTSNNGCALATDGTHLYYARYENMVGGKIDRINMATGAVDLAWASLASGSDPRWIKVGPDGSIYTANRVAGGMGGTGSISKITPTGTVTTLATFDWAPMGLAISSESTVYVGSMGSYPSVPAGVYKITQATPSPSPTPSSSSSTATTSSSTSGALPKGPALKVADVPKTITVDIGTSDSGTVAPNQPITAEVPCAAPEGTTLSSCTVNITAPQTVLLGQGDGISVRADKRVSIGKATVNAKTGKKIIVVKVKINQTGRKALQRNLKIQATVGLTAVTVARQSSTGEATTEMQLPTQLLSPQAGIFSSNSTTLNAAGVQFVNRLAALLPKSPKKMVFIGFADNTGVPGDNRWLGDRRAKAVRAALEAKGIVAVKSEIETKAARSPRDDNAKQSGRERNRRVSIRITY